MVQRKSRCIDDKSRVAVVGVFDSLKSLLQEPSPTTIANSTENWVQAVPRSPSLYRSRSENNTNAPVLPQSTHYCNKSKQPQPPRRPLHPTCDNQASTPTYTTLKRKMSSDSTTDSVHNPPTRPKRACRETPSHDLVKTPTRKGRYKTTTRGTESEETDKERLGEQGICTKYVDDNRDLSVQTPCGESRSRSNMTPQDRPRVATREAGSKTDIGDKSTRGAYESTHELGPLAENEFEEPMPSPIKRGPKTVHQHQKPRPDFPRPAMPFDLCPYSLHTALPSPTKSGSFCSTETGSTSPSKKGPNKGLSSIDRRPEMSQMTPPVDFKPPGQWRLIGQVSDNVRSLWVDHIRAAEENERVIPWEFRDRMQRTTNTPMKSKPSVPVSCYIPLGTTSIYAPEDLELVWSTLSDVVRSAEQYRHEACTEAHWMSKTVTPILNLVRRLRRYIDPVDDFEKLEVLDMTTVQMSESLTPHSPTSLYRDLNRKIDAAMSLRLWPSEKTTLQRGLYNTTSPPFNQPPSINQTSSFTNFSPMFTHIEVKRPNTGKDPLIQLGAWTSAEFTKRSLEEYNLDMPVCAIDVCGDDWDIYLVFASMIDAGAKGSFTTQFVGPVKMGDTRSPRGCFMLLAFLINVADWGLGAYRQWFERDVLDLYRLESRAGE